MIQTASFSKAGTGYQAETKISSDYRYQTWLTSYHRISMKLIIIVDEMERFYQVPQSIYKSIERISV